MGWIGAIVGAVFLAPMMVVSLFLLVLTGPATDSATTSACGTAKTQLPTAANVTGKTGAALAASAAQEAGFTGNDLVTAVAVAGAESGYRPAVRNSIGASGLWQILQSAHQDLWSMGDWRDPAVNARMAYSVWKAAGRRWTPWTTYTGKSYAKYVPMAQTAVAALPARVGGVVVAPVVCVQPATFSTSSGGPSPAQFDKLGNHRTVAQAMAWADREVGAHIPVGQCDHYVALAYGWPNSGSTTALTHWQAIPAQYRHPGTSPAPRGALLFWATGWAGHVAIADGSGGVYSTDVTSKGFTAGVYGHVPQKVVNRWGKLLGWAAPDFPGH
jgi:hypothetical protein